MAREARQQTAQEAHNEALRRKAETQEQAEKAKESEVLKGILSNLQKQNAKKGTFRKGNEKIDSVRMQMREDNIRGNGFKTNTASVIADKLQEMSEESAKATRFEQKLMVDQLKNLQELITAVDDPVEKRRLEELSAQMKAGLEQNAKMTTRLIDGVVDKLPEIGGIVAGVLGKSPALAVLTSFAGSKLKELYQKRQEAKAANLASADSTYEAALRAEVENERAKPEPAAEEAFPPHASNDETTPSKLHLGDDQVVDVLLDSLIELEDIKKGIEKIEKGEGPDVESQREAAIVQNRLIEAIENLTTEVGNSPSRSKDDEEGTGIFGWLFGGLLAGGVMGYAKKLGPKLLKGFKFFMKKLPIIGPLIAGGLGVFDEVTKSLESDDSIGMTILKAFRGFTQGIIDGILAIPNLLLSAFGFEEIEFNLAQVGQQVSDWLNETFDNPLDPLFRGFDNLVEFFGGLGEKFSGLTFDGIKTSGLDFLEDIQTRMKEWFIDLIPDWIPDRFLPDEIVAAREAGNTLDEERVAEPGSNAVQRAGFITDNTLQNELSREGGLGGSQTNNQVISASNTINNTQTVVVKRSARNHEPTLPRIAQPSII